VASTAAPPTLVLANLVRNATRLTIALVGVAVSVFLMAFQASLLIGFIQAARLALITFDPYLSSYELAEALEKSPPGQLIEGDAYYAFSATFFYTNQAALLWNGRSANLEYGSYAPGAKQVFVGDDELKSRWGSSVRTYLLTYGSDIPHLNDLLEKRFKVVATSGGNYLLVNQ